MEAGSPAENGFSSGLLSAVSPGLSELDDEAGDVAGAVVLEAEAACEGCGAAEAVLGCKTI